MFVFGHLGVGSWVIARRVRAEQLAWVLFGTLLADLIDKPLYYALVLATGRHGAALGTRPRPGTITAILFPFLGLHFPVSPFRSAMEHLVSLSNAYVLAGEIAGAALLAWQWRAGLFTRRPPAERGASGSTPASP